MPLTLEQIEEQLKALREENRILRKPTPQINPFDSLEFQLSLENGHTVSARTRKMSMSVLSTPNYPTAGIIAFSDGTTRDLRSSVVVPSDWVIGTALTVNVMVYKTGTGDEVANLLHWISAKSNTEAFSWNIESSATQLATINASSELRTITRTITGTDVEHGEMLHWIMRRQGGQGNDTLNEVLILQFGPWLEYTAFF